MNKVHLNDQQIALCQEFRQFEERPTFEQYEAFQKRMKVIDKSLGKIDVKKIPNTERGFEPKERQLLPAFDAFKDLPQGWAVYPMFDSGNNHAVMSAGQHILTRIWNGWYTIAKMPNLCDTVMLLEKRTLDESLKLETPT